MTMIDESSATPACRRHCVLVLGHVPLLGHRSVLFKLHSLSVADTLGSMAIVGGLLLQIPEEWPLLLLALITLAIWNTVLGYVLAYCSSEGGEHG
jgi:multicomponent Na+:H+ antiporter subunit G